jgi:hypothetical protein
MPKTPAVDPDAQAFITAAAITDPTQQAAINTLVVDLKGYSIWNKMKAIYPIVGGTAATHKWNLKDPRDLDAAFRLVFSGGVTHSINGVQFGGVNGYANTFLNSSVNLTNSNNHFSVYSRTSSVVATTVEMGCANTGAVNFNHLRVAVNYLAGHITSTNFTSTTNAQGFWLGNKVANNDRRVYKNSTKEATNTTVDSTTLPNFNVFIGARNDNGTAAVYSDKQCAFASIGDGLTDTEAANFYTAVQTFQTTLGRSIGTQTVSDADAQAFVTNAGIVDQVEANAINNLVIGMKADGLWTKMKAVYPFVGGTATTHKFNLKDPRDLDAAFRILWNGGVNHSANGITGNQMNAYGDTRLNNQSVLNNNNKHISIYQRNILPTISNASMGITNTDRFYLNYLGSNFSTLGMNQSAFTAQAPQQGMFTMSKIASGSFKYYQNNLTPVTKTGTDINNNLSYVLLASNSGPGNIADLSIANLAFASIGDGLTDTESANLNTRVTTFQTALNRNV